MHARGQPMVAPTDNGGSICKKLRRPYNQAKRVGKLACQRASADCSANVLRKAKQSA